MTRLPRAKHFIPSGPPAAFEVIDPATSPVGWHIKIRDAIVGDEPEFLLPRTVGKGKTLRVLTLDEVCRAGFREATEGRGVLHLTEWRHGVPVYQARVACWPGWVVATVRGAMAAVPQFKPLWSTDPARTARELPYHAPPEHFIHPYMRTK